MGLKNRNITGILGFDVGRTITAPNVSTPVHYIAAVGADTDIDVAVLPKRAGAIVATIPDNTATGGSKRGQYATDWQRSRSTAYQVASGNTATISGGMRNMASGDYSTVSGGQSNMAGQAYAVVSGGQSNTANAGSSFIGGGGNNTASQPYTVVVGGIGLGAYIKGQSVSGGYSGNFTKARQDSKLTMQLSTTAATATEMFIDGSTRAVLNNKCAWAFDITILAHSSTNVLHTARFKRSGLILRGASAATTTLEGAVQTIGTDIINSNLSGCAVAITADTTNGSLKVEVTGIAATTIVWQAKIELVEIEI